MRGLVDDFGPGYLTRGGEDVHVHTEACDDADQTAMEALRDASARGLGLVCFTAHVRESTPLSHVEDYLAATRSAAAQFPNIVVRYSLETKLMNTDGDLDLPPGLDLEMLDSLNVSDHRFPLDTALAPSEVTERIANGSLSESDAWDALLAATCNAILRYQNAIVAHPLSIIPKIGLDQQDVPAGFCTALAQAMQASRSVMEVNNKWSCPSLKLIEAAHQTGVPVVAASDAHHAGETGANDYLKVLGLAEGPR